jgi:hypothetical protein
LSAGIVLAGVVVLAIGVVAVVEAEAIGAPEDVEPLAPTLALGFEVLSLLVEGVVGAVWLLVGALGAAGWVL